MAIKVDYSAMKSTIDCYKKNIDILQSNLNKISSNMTALEAEWKGDAKEAFFSKIYPNFKKAMENDIEHIKFLKEQLELVVKSFENIDNKYKNLKIKG